MNLVTSINLLKSTQTHGPRGLPPVRWNILKSPDLSLDATFSDAKCVRRWDAKSWITNKTPPVKITTIMVGGVVVYCCFSRNPRHVDPRSRVPSDSVYDAQVHILDQRCLCREFEVSVCLTDGFQPPCWNSHQHTPGNSNLPVLCLSRFARRRCGPRGFSEGSVLSYWQFLLGIHPRWSWWYTMVHALHPGCPLMGGGEAYLNSRKVWCKDIKIFNYLHRPGLGLEQLLCQHRRRRRRRIICERSHREQCWWISVPVDCRKVDRFIDIAVLFVQPLLVPRLL